MVGQGHGLQPASAASSGIRSGGSLPSETVEWVWRSITQAEATGRSADASGRPTGLRPVEARPLGWSGTVRSLVWLDRGEDEPDDPRCVR